MHFRHRQMDRRTGIIAYARDVYITSRAKKHKNNAGRSILGMAYDAEGFSLHDSGHCPPQTLGPVDGL